MSDDRPATPESPGRSAVETDLRRLFRLSLDLMCVAGFDGYFKKVNPAFERILGYDRDELLSRQFIEFVHADDRDKTLREVERLAGGRTTVDFENRYLTRSGDYRWLAWRAAPMVDQELIYAVARDITEHKRAQEQLERQAGELERSNADLERFAYVASHDLRAPLRSIISLARFLEQDLADSMPESSRDHLDELKRRARAMQALTDDLLVFSQAGGDAEEIVALDTAELVAEVAFLLDPPPGLEIRTDGDLPVIEATRGPLAQVLRNLIGNAVRHHDRERGTIEVSVRDRGDEWEFAVADDGPGVPEADRDRIFHLFRQLGGDSLEGTGMGLTLVERIVGRAGGTVTLDAAAGRGATFRFTWPKPAPGREPE